MKIGKNLFDDFDFWNETLFGGYLITPELHLFTDKQIKSEQGQDFDVFGFTLTDATDQELYINSTLCSNWGVYHETLIHEMVHIWQAQYNHKVNHGTEFKRMRKLTRQITGIEI